MFVTPLYAGLLTLIFVVLGLRAARLTGSRSAPANHGDPTVVGVLRAPTDFAEYVPLALLLLGLLEAGRNSIYVLHALGVLLVVARVLHGAALSFGLGERRGRITGATLTFVVLVVEALLSLYQGIKGQWLWLQ